MSTAIPTVRVHVLDVGQGNMVLVILPNDFALLVDCNVTYANESRILAALRRLLPNQRIGIFVNSHRDADHMRGIDTVHGSFPIGGIWDSGVGGTSTNTPEYRAFMALKRKLPCTEINGGEYFSDKTGGASIRVLKSRSMPNVDPNAQSIVLKVQSGDGVGASIILPGDSDAVAWKYIMRSYANYVDCTVLLASHHGAVTFFDDPSDTKSYYTTHIRAMKPMMCVISVGPNTFGHPDAKAVDLYGKYCMGSAQGKKVARTDKNGDVSIELRTDNSMRIHAPRGSFQ